MIGCLQPEWMVWHPHLSPKSLQDDVRKSSIPIPVLYLLSGSAEMKTTVWSVIWFIPMWLRFCVVPEPIRYVSYLLGGMLKPSVNAVRKRIVLAGRPRCCTCIAEALGIDYCDPSHGFNCSMVKYQAPSLMLFLRGVTERPDSQLLKSCGVTMGR